MDDSDISYSESGTLDCSILSTSYSDDCGSGSESDTSSEPKSSSEECSDSSSSSSSEEDIDKLADAVDEFILCCENVIIEKIEDGDSNKITNSITKHFYEYTKTHNINEISQHCLDAYDKIREKIKPILFSKSESIFKDWIDGSVDIGKIKHPRIYLSQIYFKADKKKSESKKNNQNKNNQSNSVKKGKGDIINDNDNTTKDMLLKSYLTVVFYSMDQIKDRNEMQRIAHICDLTMPKQDNSALKEILLNKMAEGVSEAYKSVKEDINESMGLIKSDYLPEGVTFGERGQAEHNKRIQTWEKGITALDTISTTITKK